MEDWGKKKKKDALERHYLKDVKWGRGKIKKCAEILSLNYKGQCYPIARNIEYEVILEIQMKRHTRFQKIGKRWWIWGYKFGSLLPRNYKWSQGSVNKLRKGVGKEKTAEFPCLVEGPKHALKEDSDSTFRKVQRTNKKPKRGVFKEVDNAVEVRENKNQQNIVFDY